MIILDSVAQNLFLEEEYIPELPLQESPESFFLDSPDSYFVNGDTIIFEEDVIDLSSMSSHHLSPEASVLDWSDFSLNVDFGDSDTDIFFEDDDETFLADAASDDACVIQTNELILKARDGGSCKAREDEYLSPEVLQFLEDPMKSFEDLLPPEKHRSGSSEPPDPIKPSYPGLLTEQESKQKLRIPAAMDWNLKAMELEEYEATDQFYCLKYRPIGVCCDGPPEIPHLSPTLGTVYEIIENCDRGTFFTWLSWTEILNAS